MDTRCPGELGDPDHGVFHVPGRDHHQVGQLVHDHQQVRVRQVGALAARRRGELARADRLVEVVDVPEPRRGQVVVAPVHLPDHPAQRLGGLLRAGDDRRDQVRDALVVRQLHPLRVDQDHSHVVRGGPQQNRRDQAIHACGLARSGTASDKQMRHLREVGDDRGALDVLAQAHHHRVVVGQRDR